MSKVTNLDLSNKISLLENKLDVVMTKVQNESIVGCCECREKETLIYNELRLYLSDKFTEFENDLQSRLQQFDKSVDFFRDIFENYKSELIGNLEILANHITKNESFSKMNDITLSKIYELLDTSQTENQELLKKNNVHIVNYNKRLDTVVDINSKLQNLIKTTDLHNVNILKRLDMLFYENEMIKHQLLIEDELRKYSEEIYNLKQKIQSTLNDVTSLIKQEQEN
jgi:predicted HTH domain antitoxin